MRRRQPGNHLNHHQWRTGQKVQAFQNAIQRCSKPWQRGQATNRFPVVKSGRRRYSTVARENLWPHAGQTSQVRAKRDGTVTVSSSAMGLRFSGGKGLPCLGANTIKSHSAKEVPIAPDRLEKARCLLL